MRKKEGTIRVAVVLESSFCSVKERKKLDCHIYTKVTTITGDPND